MENSNIKNTVMLCGSRQEIQLILDALERLGFTWYTTGTYRQRFARVPRFSEATWGGIAVRRRHGVEQLLQLYYS